MIVDSNFKPAWWLINSHAQTIYPALLRRIKAPVDRTERLELPDGDFVDLSWAINDHDANSPLVVLLHGLGGNIDSCYIAGLMQALDHCGYRSVLMHFRGASKEPNRLPRAYHSGDTVDLNYFLHLLAKREPHTKKAVIGISLGGNVLLKWLGEQGRQHLIDVAIAVSVPFQLGLVADKISSGLARLYQNYLLRRLKSIFEQKLSCHKGEIPDPLKNLSKWQCFWTFDEFVTAPLNGFPHVHAYYREASSRYYLARICTPTLIIHAMDDPFMTPEIIPLAHELSDSIILELSQTGGHVGFVTGNIPGSPIYWLEKRIPDFLNPILNPQPH